MAKVIVDVVLNYSRSTKGTHVYSEKTAGEPPKVSALYLPRWAFPSANSPPETLHMKVEIP